MRNLVRPIFLALLVIGSGMLWLACEEKEVPIVVDADELVKFMESDIRGKQLFDWQTIVSPTPYTVPYQDGVRTDTVIRHARSYEVLVNSNPDVVADWGELGMLREAFVSVRDTFEIQSTVAYATDTSIDTTKRTLNRGAFFLKLGDDAQDYAGWLMWGYAIADTGIAIDADIILYDGSSVPADLSLYIEGKGSPHRYVRLDRLPEIVVGSRVVVRTSRSSSASPVYHLLSGRDTSGIFQHEMTRLDTINIDTLRMPYGSQNPRQYGLFCLQQFDATDGAFRHAWATPFRVRF